MSLSVPTQKDIGEYQEKIVAGLSGRSLGFLAIGVVLVVIEVLVFVVGFHMSVRSMALPIFASMGACFALGFLKPLGLPMTLAIKLFWQQWTTSRHLIYKSSVYLRTKETEQLQRKVKDVLDKEKNKNKEAYVWNDEKKADKRKRELRCAERELPILAAYEAKCGVVGQGCTECDPQVVATRAEREREEWEAFIAERAKRSCKEGSRETASAKENSAGTQTVN